MADDLKTGSCIRAKHSSLIDITGIGRTMCDVHYIAAITRMSVERWLSPIGVPRGFRRKNVRQVVAAA
ncbi:MAG: hypothetical protein EOR00_28730 [Mesorhizobium sp.]|uniref:hypothetical protein n=1 Tax=Mesorhizobium sp. TaxID=1871066 RepID=UPI000FEA1891|nr:hypothetical protein [Mesorhizobium sp.]RWP11455.1 MAG: hypothetical protein EOR00_28730 [Mesorhizobium sp.]